MMKRERLRTGAESAHDPREVRRVVLEEVLTHAGADAVWYFSLAEVDGTAMVSDWQTVGDPVASGILRALVFHPHILPATLLDRIKHPTAAQTQSFGEGLTTPWTEMLHDTELYRRVLAPAGFVDLARLLIYDKSRFVGTVGAVRLGNSKRFSRNDRRRLTPHIERISSSLLTADSLIRDPMPRTPGAYVVMRASGEVDYASAVGHDWLTREDFADALGELIRELVVEGKQETVIVLRQAETRVLRLDGGGELRFLVKLAPAAPLRASIDNTLSPVQRQIAQFAASGATVAQIAETLQRSAETVRHHLKEAYSRLGVSSRLELARTLEGGDELTDPGDLH